MALIAGTEVEMKQLLASFLAYFGKSGIQHQRIEREGREIYKVLDKYEGGWFLIRSGDSIFCLFGIDDEKILNLFIKGKG